MVCLGNKKRLVQKLVFNFAKKSICHEFVTKHKNTRFSILENLVFIGVLNVKLQMHSAGLESDFLTPKKVDKIVVFLLNTKFCIGF